ncbi:sulfotransferase 1C2-like [Glandiceps talaboti]
MAVTREHPAWQKNFMRNPMFDPEGKLQTMEIRPDDLFLITYPKSGTHWLKFLIRAMLNNGNYEEVPDEIRGPFLEIAFAEEGDEPSLVICQKHPDNSVDIPGMKSPRFLVTHLSLDLGPTKMNTKKPKIIYLARNPKDCVVSMFNMLELIPFIDKSSSTAAERFDGHLRSFLDDQSAGMYAGKWNDNVISYWKRRNDDNILFLKYEDMKKDFKCSIEKIAQFIGKTLSMDEIDKLADLCSIEKMRHNPVANDSTGCAILGITGTLDKAEGTPFAGKGKIGGWKNYFTVAQNELFDKHYQEWMKGTGLDFDFE